MLADNYSDNSDNYSACRQNKGVTLVNELRRMHRFKVGLPQLAPANTACRRHHWKRQTSPDCWFPRKRCRIVRTRWVLEDIHIFYVIPLIVFVSLNPLMPSIQNIINMSVFLTITPLRSDLEGRLKLSLCSKMYSGNIQIIFAIYYLKSYSYSSWAIDGRRCIALKFNRVTRSHHQYCVIRVFMCDSLRSKI